MSIAGSIEATRELCFDLDSLIELTKESRAPIRALSLIERAREDLQAYLDGSSERQALPAPGRARAEGEGEISELKPTPELPDDTPIREVQFPTRIENVLFAAELKSVGEVREMSDEASLSLPDFGKASIGTRADDIGLPAMPRTFRLFEG